MTSTNQIFDIRRFWKYVCYDLRINNKEYLKALGITALFFLFIIVTQYIFLGNFFDREGKDIAILLSFVIFVAIGTRERARNRIVKKNGLQYLISVPASNFEKFLNTALIQVTIGLIIGIIFALLGVAIYTFVHTKDFSIALFVREFKTIFTIKHFYKLKDFDYMLIFLIFLIPLNMSANIYNKVHADLRRSYKVVYHLLIIAVFAIIYFSVFIITHKVFLSLPVVSTFVFYILGLIYFYFVLKNVSIN